MYLLSEDAFAILLELLEKQFTVYIPEKKNEKLYYSAFGKNGKKYTIDEVRACEPLKSFFFKAREKVSEDFKDAIPPQVTKPLCIVGAKACDLKGFKVQDYVFLTGDYRDPFYENMRKHNLVISADCSCALDTCFCLALGVKPFPEDDFDINLSKINGGYLVTAGSDKGRAIINDNKNLLQEASAGQREQQTEMRNKVQSQVGENLKKHKIPSEHQLKGSVKKNYKYMFWNQEAVRCVECGACNTICPTCHCFLLYDQGDKKKAARFKTWDSCLLKGFAQVAGGANPRRELWMRLRNRFEKKFDFFPQVLGLNACTGCGRCISACPANIDIRKVLRRLAGNE